MIFKNISNLKSQVGWGHDGGSTPNQDKLKQVLVRAVNDSTCFSIDHHLGSIYSSRHFCASGKDEGPCSGDSGGGFFIKFRGLWTLRGTVSAGAFKTEGGCDVGRFALYTKLNEYAAWIAKSVEDSLLVSTSTQSLPTSTSRHDGDVGPKIGTAKIPITKPSASSIIKTVEGDYSTSTTTQHPLSFTSILPTSRKYLPRNEFF